MRNKNELPSNFYHDINDILKKFSHTNNIEDCKIAMRDYLQPYWFDWSIEKLDEAFKQILNWHSRCNCFHFNST